MNDQGNSSDQYAYDYDRRTKAGVKRIHSQWKRLLPETRNLLMQDGFDCRGLLQSSFEDWNSNDTLVYSLGLFEEAVSASLPNNTGDVMPSFYLSDEVLNESANLVFIAQHCDPEFTRLALHACMKHQAANAVFNFFSNRAVYAGTRSGWGLARMSIAMISFSIMLSICIGNGLVSAFHNDAVTSSFCVFLGIFSYVTLMNLSKPDEKSHWEIARTAWSSLIYRDFHVGTANGVEKQLSDFLRQGVHVPSVLFDLCATLQQGTQYRILSNPK